MNEVISLDQAIEILSEPIPEKEYRYQGIEPLTGAPIMLTENHPALSQEQARRRVAAKRYISKHHPSLRVAIANWNTP